MARSRNVAAPAQDALPIERILRPFQEFAAVEASGGIVLLACTAIALAWANSPWAERYDRFWSTTLTIGAPGFALSKPLLLWIDDGLMAVFFFVIGLEIKREILVGELSTPRNALLPIAAALGGMLAPAAIYAAVNAGGPGARGWAVPMATDIAFALGVLAMLGRRVPLALKVFLAALAIVDDLGAVLVIALFYTGKIGWGPLALAAVAFAALVAANCAGVRRPLPYVLIGMVMWVAILKSGVHATLAGVLVAMTIPARPRIDVPAFLASARAILDDLEGAAGDQEKRMAAVQALEVACEHVETPLQRLEHALHPWVTFLILPVFALANAGVSLRGDLAGAFADRIALGVVLGLVLGKQIGIALASWLAVRTGLAALPAGVTWRHIYGAAWLGGIGFTMALFIAGLAFEDPAQLARAKTGILAASAVAGAVGWGILRRGSEPADQTHLLRKHPVLGVGGVRKIPIDADCG